MNFLFDAKIASNHSKSNVSFAVNTLKDMYAEQDKKNQNDKIFNNFVTSSTFNNNGVNKNFYEIYLNLLKSKIHKQEFVYKKKSKSK